MTKIDNAYISLKMSASYAKSFSKTTSKSYEEHSTYEQMKNGESIQDGIESREHF